MRVRIIYRRFQPRPICGHSRKSPLPALRVQGYNIWQHISDGYRGLGKWHQVVQRCSASTRDNSSYQSGFAAGNLLRGNEFKLRDV